MLKDWIDFLWKLKEYSIRDFEEFVELNTYILTPEVSLPAYLGLSKKSTSQSEQERIREALKKLSNIRYDCQEILRNDPFLIDFLVSLGLSYELLSRLMIYMKEKGFLPTDTSLPSSNWYENIESRARLRDIVAKVLCDILSMKLSEKLNNDDELLRAISLEISSIEEMFSSILENIQAIKENVYGQMFIRWMYIRSKKGSTKASSGIEYEVILRDYLRMHPVIQPVVDQLNFMPGGRYEDKNIDGYVEIKNRRKWLVIFESTYQITTGSGQTSKVDRILDERRIEALMNDMIALSILLDGTGWISRKNDAKKFFERGVKKYPHIFVFTYHKTSLEKLARFIKDLYYFHAGTYD